MAFASLCASAVLALTANAASIPVEHFVSKDRYQDPVLSPDGKHLAIRMDAREFLQTYPSVVILTVPELKPVATLAFGRFQMPHRFQWLTNSRLLISEATLDTWAEVPIPTGNLLATDIDARNQRYLTGLHQGFGRAAGVPAARDGHVLIEIVALSDHKSRLYDIDSVTGARTLVAELEGEDFRFHVDAAGKPRAATRVSFDEPLQLRYLDPKGVWQSMAEPDALPVHVIGVSSDGKRLFELCRRHGAPDALTERQVGSPTRTVLAQETDADIDTVYRSRSSGRPYAYLAGLGVPKLRILDPLAPEARVLAKLGPQFPGEIVELVSGSDDGSKWLFVVRSDRDPGAYYLFDQTTGRADLLFSLLEQLDPSSMPPRLPISFKARDGTQLHGFLTMPMPERKSPPLIVMPHGGPHGVEDSWWFDEDAAFLSSRGYAVLQVNFRGSGGRGEDFERAGYRHWSDLIQDDLIDGVRWVGAQGLADPGRVCAVGASFGAYSAMLLPARAPGMFRCAVGLAGVYDLNAWYRDRLPSVLAYVKAAVGEEEAQRRSASPVAVAARIGVPVFLIHGEYDGRAEMVQAKLMQDALRSAGNAPDLWTVIGEGHGLYDAQNKRSYYDKLERFLARHLQGQ